ncbi:hypothetical protein MMC07_005734 [Pseudocyphellaria aurata]|nr:hypothetical protein [Pseudocyphellaria aurata]
MTDLKPSRSPLEHPFPPPGLSLAAAVARLETLHLASRPRSSTAGELLALLQLRTYLPTLRDTDARRGTWYADVARKIFPDLDQALFEGRLCGNVCVSWTSEDEEDAWPYDNEAETAETLGEKSGMTCAPRTWWTTPGSGVGSRIWIRLNADVMLLDARKTLMDLLRVLLREMVTAYIILLSGISPSPPPSPHKDEERLFARAIAAVTGALSRVVGFPV